MVLENYATVLIIFFDIIFILVNLNQYTRITEKKKEKSCIPIINKTYGLPKNIKNLG